MSRPSKGVGAGPRALSVLYLDRVLVSFVHGSVFGTITSPCKIYRVRRLSAPGGGTEQMVSSGVPLEGRFVGPQADPRARPETPL